MPERVAAAGLADGKCKVSLWMKLCCSAVWTHLVSYTNPPVTIMYRQCSTSKTMFVWTSGCLSCDSCQIDVFCQTLCADWRRQLSQVGTVSVSHVGSVKETSCLSPKHKRSAVRQAAKINFCSHTLSTRPGSPGRFVTDREFNKV